MWFCKKKRSLTPKEFKTLAEGFNLIVSVIKDGTINSPYTTIETLYDALFEDYIDSCCGDEEE
ncbi:hypothetical protein M0R19_05300 [Candidatus Pacearchaeota archaeon]|jgi:hypothetical protein|nr:hypothetical protein [Candidatus Pacearchaeota archaeon]